MTVPVTPQSTLATLIRDLRKHRGLTLDELSRRIERSVGFLSQVERGLSQPTVADLTAISAALGVSTTYFYDADQPRALPWVTRPHERRTLNFAAGITDTLASPSIGGGFFMLESHLEPGASSGDDVLDDSSEQGGYVLEGRLSLWLEPDPEPVQLAPGDSFQLPAHARFRYANLTDQPVRVLWVYTDKPRTPARTSR